MCAMNLSQWPFVRRHPVTIRHMQWRWISNNSHFTALEVPLSFVNAHTWAALKAILEYYLDEDPGSVEYVAGDQHAMSLHRGAPHVKNKLKFGLTSSKPNRDAHPPFRDMGPRIYFQGIHPNFVPPHQAPPTGWLSQEALSRYPAFQCSGISQMMEDMNLYVAQMCHHDQAEHSHPLCWFYPRCHRGHECRFLHVVFDDSGRHRATQATSAQPAQDARSHMISLDVDADW